VQRSSPMQSNDHNSFKSHFGRPIPPAILELCGDDAIQNSLPLEFRFSHVPFVLEIQYMLDLDDPQHYDVENKRLSFAVNGDGFTLLVDLGTEDLRIMQDEFGDVDYLGLTIRDLLDAEKSPLQG